MSPTMRTARPPAGHGAHVRGAAPAVEQGELADHVTGAERAHGLTVTHGLELAGDDDRGGGAVNPYPYAARACGG